MLGLNTKKPIETPTFATIPGTQRLPTSQRQRRRSPRQDAPVSNCPACPKLVLHDPERCQLVRGSKWTEDGAKDVAQSPLQERQRRPRLSTVSPTWPGEFDVANLPDKSDKKQGSRRLGRKGSAIRKAVESAGSSLMPKITILKRPASASKEWSSKASKIISRKSLAQRKAEYDQARLRIMGSTEPETVLVNYVKNAKIKTPS